MINIVANFPKTWKEKFNRERDLNKFLDEWAESAPHIVNFGDNFNGEAISFNPRPTHTENEYDISHIRRGD